MARIGSQHAQRHPQCGRLARTSEADERTNLSVGQLKVQSTPPPCIRPAGPGSPTRSARRSSGPSPTSSAARRQGHRNMAGLGLGRPAQQDRRGGPHHGPCSSSRLVGGCAGADQGLANRLLVAALEAQQPHAKRAWPRRAGCGPGTGETTTRAPLRARSARPGSRPPLARAGVLTLAGRRRPVRSPDRTCPPPGRTPCWRSAGRRSSVTLQPLQRSGPPTRCRSQTRGTGAGRCHANVSGQSEQSCRNDTQSQLPSNRISRSTCPVSTARGPSSRTARRTPRRTRSGPARARSI